MPRSFALAKPPNDKTRDQGNYVLSVCCESRVVSVLSLAVT